MTNDTAREIMSYRWVLFKRHLSDDDMDDIMQDAILKLLQFDSKLEKLVPGERKLYIKRCINNSYVDIVRRRNRKRSNQGITMRMPDYLSLDNDIGAALSAPPDVYVKMELKDIIEKSKKRKTVCEALFLFAAGYSGHEIAAIQGVDKNVITQRCRYARKFLKNDKKSIRHRSKRGTEPVEGHSAK